MGYALKYEQELETLSCGGCGMEYAVPSTWLEEKRNTNGSFHCPNGCNRRFNGESWQQKIERLEREKTNAEVSKRFAEQRLELEKSNHQKELKRRDKRAHAGVCQECHRTFANMARHMKTKHSDH